MIWTADKTTFFAEYIFAEMKQKEIMLQAFRVACDHFGGERSMDDFIVIRVQGYNCLALVTDEFEPIEIADMVFPFDATRTYPMQRIKQEITFTIN